MKIAEQRQLEELLELLKKQVVPQKEIMNLEVAAIYMGISKSYLYKLTSAKKIPFYRPAIKLIYFKRTELDEWLLKNRSCTIAELSNANPKKGAA